MQSGPYNGISTELIGTEELVVSRPLRFDLSRADPNYSVVPVERQIQGRLLVRDVEKSVAQIAQLIAFCIHRDSLQSNGRPKPFYVNRLIAGVFPRKQRSKPLCPLVVKSDRYGVRISKRRVSLQIHLPNENKNNPSATRRSPLQQETA